MMDEILDEIAESRVVDACVYEEADDFNFFQDHNVNVNDSITILSLNIRSFNKHVDELMIVLGSYNHSFDIIVLTETWLDESSANVSMDGYDVIVNKVSKNQNDGVIVFVNKCLAVCSEEVVLHGATCIRADIAFGSERLSLLSVYRSPSSDLGLFIDDLETYLDGRRRGSEYWLVGDVNCCILPGTMDQLAQRYLDVLYGAGFVSCVNIPTRVTGFSASCIDHVFTDVRNTDLIKSAVIKTEITDHYLTVAQFQSRRKKTMNESFSSNKTTFLDMEAACRLVSGWDWSPVLNTIDANLSSNIFVEQLQSVMDKSTKIKKYSSKVSRLKPWMTAGLLRSVRTRDEMSRRIKKQPFNTALKTRFRNYRNILTKIIRSAKQLYYRRKIDDSKNNNRQMWRNIAEVMGIKKSKDIFPVEHFFKDSDIVGPDEIKHVSDLLNEYYVGVGANLAGAFPPESETVVNDREFQVDADFQLEPVTEAGLSRIVSSLKGGSAPGIDNIPATLIKNNFHALKLPLLHIINKSINQGIFPTIFKLGKVIPIYKGGPKDQFVSFRPITLASVLSKLLEKCIRYQLEKYLIEHDILFQNQFGFRKDKNLNDDLFILTKNIHNALERNKKSLIIFIDLAKAFDTVDRVLLLNKLECIGVRGTALNWFQSYLSDRYQTVSIFNQYSSPREIEYGVLQGSTLGPLLFLIFVNNLGKIYLEGGQILLYADDTALLFEGDSWEEALDVAERGLLDVTRWFDQCRLTVNISKTKCLPISLRADCDPVNVNLRLHTCGGRRDCVTCERVEIVSEYKYLGVIFDNRMKWTSHINYVRNKLRKFIFIFSSLNKILAPDLLKTVYYAYVQSLLQYGILAWGGCFQTILSPLEIIQKTIIKAALKKNRRFPTELLFEEFKVLNISQLYIRSLIMYIYNNKDTMFNQISHSYSTRASANIGINAPRLVKTITTTSSHYIANIVYTKIPSHIKNPPPCSIDAYKRIVSKWLVEVGREEIRRYLCSQYR